MKNELFRDYARIQKELELLETKRDKLKAAILSSMYEASADRIKNRYGLFSLVKRDTLSYPSEVLHMETALKHIKEVCRLDGRATVESTTVFLRHQD